METSEILKKVRKIEIKARGLSSNVFAGQYHSAFKGRGMAFSEVREYDNLNCHFAVMDEDLVLASAS